MDNFIGMRLDGRYRVDELVGEGGMANVYRGVDLSNGQTVAVKILKDEYRGNEELVRRFKNESRAISVLNHPNIVKVFDVSVSDKVHYIVMEFISGITLKEYIEQRGEPLTYKEVVHFTTQVLQAIQHAHDKGIVHRDIKPQNIMILESGNVKVMDFGIARLARSEIHTANEQAIGSVHYFSPEQAQGADTDPRADIYSVGIMMYEMLTGKLPFEDESAVQVAIKQISDSAPPVAKVNPSAPEGLSEITMKAMAKQPRLRYQSALDMLRDIEEFKVNPSIKFEYDYLLEDDAPGMAGKTVGAAQAAGAPPAPGKRPVRAAGGGGKKPPARKGKKPKRKKRIGLLLPITIGLTLAVVGICVLYSLDLIRNMSVPLFGQYENIELPNFINMKMEEVQEFLRQPTYKNLRVKESSEYNPHVPAGTVTDQRPVSSDGSPRTVKANQIVYLTVSKGIEVIEVPDLSGMTRREAMLAVLSVGLTPYMKPMISETVAPGKVIGTDPPSGERIQVLDGVVLTVYISSEAREFQRTVPQVVGFSQEDGIKMLELVDLQVGKVKEEFSEEPEGTIIDQSPAQGTKANVLDEVNLVVSKGPEPPPEPEPPASSSVVEPASSSSQSSSSAPSGTSVDSSNS